MLLRVRRLIAVYLDYVICMYINYPLILISNLFEDSTYNFISIIIDVICILIFLYTFFHKDCLIGYESIGKKIMRLKIYQNDVQVHDKNLLLKRVEKTFWSIPIYPFLILINNQTWADKELNTMVK